MTEFYTIASIALALQLQADQLYAPADTHTIHFQVDTPRQKQRAALR